MPFLLLSLVLQVALIIHIFKTGRSTAWVCVVLLLPLAGSVAYVILEILPELLGTRAGRKTQRKLVAALNPNRDLKNAVLDYQLADTVDHKLRLADELLAKQEFTAAKALLVSCLAGQHQYDPHIMFRLAAAEFGLENFPAVLTLMDELIRHNPDFKNADAHLLYARVAEKSGNLSLAHQEYAVLDSYFPGPEATYHYANLLARSGEHEKSQRLLGKIIALSQRSGRHYNELHLPWIKAAKAEFRGQ